MSDMRRREFIMLLGGAAAVWPLAANAQQPVRIAKIGHIESSFSAFAVCQVPWILDAESAGAGARRHHALLEWGEGAARPAVAHCCFRIGRTSQLGLFASLNRPGGNVTGVTALARLVVAKQFEVLHEIVLKAVIGCLVNPITGAFDRCASGILINRSLAGREIARTRALFGWLP
jgi:putative ABC transport system substrate-binding protein